MTRQIGWELYRTFLWVLKERSLSAARALNLTQPTVGRHIAALEEALGLALFTRSQAGLMPTDAALALRSHAESMQLTAASLERVARGYGEGVHGTVRVSASEVVGIEVLPPILAALHQTHPNLKVELVLSSKVQDLVRREADIAVRMTSPQQEVLLATNVGNVVLGLYAHKRYVDRCGRPASVSELTQHSLIGFDQETPFLRSARSVLAPWTRDNFALLCDSDLAQMALICSAAGIGVCQVALAKRSPDLVRVLPQKFSLELTTWIAMHEDLRGNPRCRATFDALVRGLRLYTR